MKQLRIGVLIVLYFVLPSFLPRAEAVSEKKVLIGLGLIGVSVILFATTFSFDSNSSDAGPIVAFVMAGAGAGILIWGLASHPSHESKFQQLMEQKREAKFAYGVFPKKNGIQGGMLLRW